ncbi:hypothetical protein B9G39_28925 [Zooshikella ganghwensis]|uniref:Uncharacterized protein n=1 Tax=Zooshikella ganghwensis TaxID=202772 RepID=A0A4P9VDZ9_9GAMM|nr:hypothetical protein B9G39_28870 [Zooshikella ganghwensis]RDH41296.1 hypothetical protein B9G39_28925 [Zooshikella ganghwensis]
MAHTFLGSSLLIIKAFIIFLIFQYINQRYLLVVVINFIYGSEKPSEIHVYFWIFLTMVLTLLELILLDKIILFIKNKMSKHKYTK